MVLGMCEYRPAPASPRTRLVFERAVRSCRFATDRTRRTPLRGRLAALPSGTGGPAPGTTPPRPPTATHPSLLRISELRRITGVFEVFPGVHQVRTLEDRNVTLVDSDSDSDRGRVLVDAPRRATVTRAAVALVDQHTGPRPVVVQLWNGAPSGTAAIDGLSVQSIRVRDAAVDEVLHWFPDRGFLYAGTSIQHSLPPLSSGGRVRDPVAWSEALHEVLVGHRDRFALVAGARDWPTWGNGRVRQLLADQRALLRYVHEEVSRLGYRGHTPGEVVGLLQLPPALAENWHARGYDATVEADVHLLYPGEGGSGAPEPSPWQPPVSLAAATRFLGWAGGLPGAVERLHAAHREGDYRWVAQARELAMVAAREVAELRRVTARAYEQLSCQEENIGRHEVFAERAQRLAVGRTEVRHTETYCVAGRDVDRLFDHLGLRLEGPRAAQHPLHLRWTVTDSATAHLLEVHNGTLFATPDSTRRHSATPVEVGLTSTRAALAELACDHTDWRAAVRDGTVRVDGDLELFDLFFGLLDRWPCLLHPRGTAPRPFP